MAPDKTSGMRTFSLYEFVAVLVPGAILTTGLWFVPDLQRLLGEGQGPGGLIATAVFLLLSYGAGHVAQAGGNLIELVYWCFWSGPPADWIRSGGRPLLSSAQLKSVETALRDLVPSLPQDFREVSRDDWRALKCELSATLSEGGCLGRADIMTANYHLCRALPICCVTLGLALGFTAALTWTQQLLLGFLCITIVAASLWRMHRFAEHSAREFYMQLIRVHAARHKHPASSPT